MTAMIRSGQYRIRQIPQELTAAAAPCAEPRTLVSRPEVRPVFEVTEP
ncbi:hypothetical protein ACGVWS_15765 [Enterobacteriaceae bacterium LUAb1]